MLQILPCLALMAAPAAVPAAQAVQPLGQLQRLAIPANPGDGPVRIAVQLDGLPVVLDLRRHVLRAPDFQLFVTRPDGSLAEMPAPPPNTWRGTVEGLPEATVTATISNAGLTAIVDDLLIGELWQIQPAAGYDGDVYSVARASELDLPDGSCPVQVPTLPPDATADAWVRGTGLQLCELALDCDYEFFLDNGSSVSASLNQMEGVINRTDEIFTRDTDVTFQLTAIIVRTTSADPYTTNNASALLDQFRSHWNNQQSFIQQDLAHLFTGRNLSGSTVGIAFTPGVCSSAGYGLTERVSSSIVAVTGICAHEIGHNFSAQHCNNITDCRLMCASTNGCLNDNSQFGAASSSVIANYAISRSCLLDLPLPVSIPFTDSVGTQVNTAFWISNQGVQSSTAAVGEPSGSRSYRFNAANSQPNADDVLISNRLLLGSLSSAEVRMETQARGVSAGDFLRVELFDNQGDWVEIGRVTSNGATQSAFVPQAFPLPTSAFHDNAQLRISASVDSTSENWYVDDITVDDTSCGQITVYCFADANSTGSIGELSTLGSTSVSTNDLNFFATSLPPQQFGLLVYGDTTTLTPLGDGFLCVNGSPIYRYAIAQADVFGQAGIFFDQTNLPPGSSIFPGDVLNFQFWHRDATPGGANLTLPLSVEFCP